MNLEMFSEQRIELLKEVKLHSMLMFMLADYEPTDFEGQLAEITAYLNITVDGYYTPDEIDTLCDICIHKLRRQRREVIMQ